MSDRIVLRKVYAVDSNTGLTMDPGNVLVTNTIGGTTWTPMMAVLSTTGGPMISYLPSTLSSFSTIGYINTSWLSTISSSYLAAICSLGAIINNRSADIVTAGLGDLGYVSTSYLEAKLSTLRDSPSTVSSMAGSLSSLGFVNLSSLSSFAGAQAMSSMSTIAGLGTMGYVSSLSLISTVAGLGTAGYISSINTPISFNSTVAGLGTSGYISTVTNLGSLGYISTSGLTSTINGLGSIYVSTTKLEKAIADFTRLRDNIRFDNVNTISIVGGTNTNTFTNVTNLIYMSTFFQSSLVYSGAKPGLEILGREMNDVNMEFSTALLRMDNFSSFIDYRSKVTIEVYPSIAFSKLATGASNVAILPISTLLKYGDGDESIIHGSLSMSYLYAGNTTTKFENGNPNADSSNMFNQPIRLSIPQGTFVRLGTNGALISNYSLPYTLYHYMPSSINESEYQNALHSTRLTPYFGSTGSLFVTVHNSV